MKRERGGRWGGGERVPMMTQVLRMQREVLRRQYFSHTIIPLETAGDFLGGGKRRWGGVELSPAARWCIRSVCMVVGVRVGVTASMLTPGVFRGRVERFCVERECCGSSLVVEMPHLAFVRRRLAVARPEDDLNFKTSTAIFLFTFNVQSDPFVPLFLCTGWGVWHMLLDTVAVYCTLRLIGGTLSSVVITWLITMVRYERSTYIYSGTPL